MRKRFSFALSLLLTLFAASGAQAQARQVTGRVYNPATQEGIPGAIVSVVGGAQAAQADEQGRYRISVPASDVTLLARAIGYKRAQASVPAGQSTADMALERDALKLDEVVVTGAATTQTRQNASTAVSTVNADELNRVPAASLDNALQGKVVGADINMNSGAPGGGGQIQIRGVTSILGNGEPLFVVDGVIISNAAFSTGINGVTRASGAVAASSQDNAVNRLADINPADIENIQILKSAAATAIYGSKATNGVVLITTKRGRTGTPRFSVTQRLGTYDAIRLPGSRRFNQQTIVDAGYLDDDEAAALCTPECPFFDYQEQLYGNHDLAYETNATVSGGSDQTKYFVSATNKYDGGTQINAGAKQQSLRMNLDQAFGSKWTANVSAQLSRAVTNRGLSNNDNTFVSPLYAFGYTPAIDDLATRDAAGNFPENRFAGGGGDDGSNPFQTLHYLTNTEDVWRQIASGTVKYTPLARENHTVTLSAIGGYDRFDAEGNVYSPNFLQYEPGDGFPGTAVQSEALSRQVNGSLNAVWEYRPSSGSGFGFLSSATTSGGVQIEERQVNRFSVLARGLVPTIDLVDQGTPTLFQNKQSVRDQAFFLNEEILAFNERLSLAGRVRGERSSVNGDRDKYFYWPAGSASYRFVNPVSFVDDLKLRVAVGTSGNQARYGDRDVILSGLGIIDGRVAIGVPGQLGNPNIEPEKMTEKEYGLDASFFDGRMGFEGSYFDRTITDLLLTAPLAPTTGFTSQVINGGKLQTTGWELAFNMIPVRTRDFSWNSRVQYYSYDTWVRELEVPSFVVASSGFGAQYGRGRIAEGYKATLIWGNRYRADSSVVDSVIGDANPDFQMQFGNDFTYKALSLNVLLDWRKGGLVSNMTQSLFDEGGNSRDYDDESPEAGVPLGEYRYDKWNAGRNAGVYIQDGSYVKLREITLSYQVPQAIANRVRARDLRLSLSGRNLAIWSDYWGSDPEVNNFGNQNVVRFVDLAPYPPTRSFFFAVDVGF